MGGDQFCTRRKCFANPNISSADIQKVFTKDKEIFAVFIMTTIFESIDTYQIFVLIL